MRSISVLPCSSNRHSSTRVACAENTAKLTPRPSQVAPRGKGVPSVTRERCCLRMRVTSGFRRFWCARGTGFLQQHGLFGFAQRHRLRLADTPRLGRCLGLRLSLSLRLGFGQFAGHFPVPFMLAMGTTFGLPDLEGKLADTLFIDHGVAPVVTGWMRSRLTGNPASAVASAMPWPVAI